MQWKKLRKRRISSFHRFLLFKLVLLPLLILVIYKYIFHQSGDVIDICILEAAMAPMITAAIIASAHDLEPKFCNLMVAVGIPLSILLWEFGIYYCNFCNLKDKKFRFISLKIFIRERNIILKIHCQ